MTSRAAIRRVPGGTPAAPSDAGRDWGAPAVPAPPSTPPEQPRSTSSGGTRRPGGAARTPSACFRPQARERPHKSGASAPSRHKWGRGRLRRPPAGHTSDGPRRAHTSDGPAPTPSTRSDGPAGAGTTPGPGPAGMTATGMTATGMTAARVTVPGGSTSTRWGGSGVPAAEPPCRWPSPTDRAAGRVNAASHARPGTPPGPGGSGSPLP